MRLVPERRLSLARSGGGRRRDHNSSKPDSPWSCITLLRKRAGIVVRGLAGVPHSAGNSLKCALV